MVGWRRAGGLVALGLRPGDVVSIMADNCPEWLYTDLGIMSAAAVPNGIYTTDSARQVEYIVNDSGTRFLFVENEEQLDKALSVRARLPLTSFGRNGQGLVIAMTKTQLEAAANAVHPAPSPS